MLGLEGKLSDERQQNGGQLPEGIAIGDGLDLPILCHHVLNLLQLLHMGPRGQISRKLFCCHLFHCVSFPSQPLQHLLSFFYSSNLYQPPGKFIKESFNQRFETTYHWLIVSLPW